MKPPPPLPSVHPYVKSTFCQNIIPYIFNGGLDMVMIILIGIYWVHKQWQV